MNKHIFIFLFSLLLGDVFGADEVKSVSVMEGDSVTLHTDDTDIQRTDLIMWKFGPKDIIIAQIDRKNNMMTIFNDNADERFRDRLKLDQTGSLIITNTRTTDSGLYKVHSRRSETPLNTFNLTVRMHAERRVSKRFNTEICLFLLLYRQIHTKLSQNTHLGEYPRGKKKPVSYVLSESRQWRKKLDVYHYNGCVVS
uniref:Immunoglobulin V-set domain-containing protein n=2 Tax=Cyprinus carpio carpio TaxID=630221 RepID=A0A9J7Y9K0_CYPCA